jgi:hypothetical protein
LLGGWEFGEEGNRTFCAGGICLQGKLGGSGRDLRPEGQMTSSGLNYFVGGSSLCGEKQVVGGQLIVLMWGKRGIAQVMC